MKDTKARTILVAAVGRAEGSFGAAAALACAAATPDDAPLLVDLGGRRARPTLISSSAANALEARMRGVAGVERSAIAARGHFCQLAASSDRAGLEEVAAAVAVTQAPKLVVLHLPGRLLAAAASGGKVPLAGALLRVDLPRARWLAAEAFADSVRPASPSR